MNNDTDKDLPWIDANLITGMVHRGNTTGQSVTELLSLNQAQQNASTPKGKQVTDLMVKLSQMRIPNYLNHDLFNNCPHPGISHIHWHLLDRLENERITDWLGRCDSDYYQRIKVELDKSCFICFAMYAVAKEALLHLESNIQRRYLFKRAIAEAVCLPVRPIRIEVSESTYKELYESQFTRHPNTCKCGTEWGAMLYGATCAGCGEKRPADPAVMIQVTRQPE